MVPCVAVFNLHCNDAGNRAMEVCRLWFPEAHRAVCEAEAFGGGIMAIFESELEAAAMPFVVLVTAFVNAKDWKGKP